MIWTCERDPVGHQRAQPGHVERRLLGREVEVEDRDQHEDRAQQRVEEELDRRVLAPRAAPDADQEVHREQHELPEDVEEEEVEGDEGPEHAGLEQEKEREVALERLLDAERRDHAEEGEERRQDDHGDAQAVDADEVLDVVGGDPVRLLHQLESRVRVEARQEPDRQQHGRHRERRRRPADRVLRLGRQAEDDGRPEQRREDHQREQPVFHRILLVPSGRRCPGPPEEDATQHAEHHDVEVRVDGTGLNAPHPSADRVGRVRDRVDRPVDHKVVEEAAEP